MKLPAPLMPGEHGAWAVVFVPLLVGASLAGRVTSAVLWLALAVLSVVLCYVPAQMMLRAACGAAPDSNKAAARFWGTVYFTAGVLFVLPLLVQGRWALLEIGGLAILLFLANFFLTRRRGKTIISDLLATLGLTLSAPSGYYVVTGRLDLTAAWIWLLNFLFFGGGMIYVHMKLAATATKKAHLSLQEKLRLGGLNLAYHVFALAVVAVLAVSHGTTLFAVIAFVPMTLHALYGTLKLSTRVNFRRLGLVLLWQALLFALLLGRSARAGSEGSSAPNPSPRLPAAGAAVLPAVGDLPARIAAARPGDTLWVAPGIYRGNLHLDKKLALLGLGKPVIRGSGTGSTVLITADSCVFQGFVVEHSGRMLVHEDAGILIKSHHNCVADNELRDVLFGIYLFHSHDNLVMRNHISGRAELEMGERGSGIHLWNSQRNRLIANRITQARDGFYIQNAHHTWLEGNEVFNLRYGVHYMYADSNVFLRNRFYDNVAGAAIMYSRGIHLRHNDFLHNRGFASFGILFQDCHDSVADSNVIADNAVGLFFEASTNNRFRHNLIARNDIALQMFQNSERNTFSENNFVDNLNPLLLVGKRTLSAWSANGRGNYWSSYDGYDLDHDGIGDLPMKIQNVFDYLEGRHPHLRLYLYSPAAQALAAAAKAFPLIAVNREMDEHPLMRPVALRGHGGNRLR
ncbi:MAG: YwiC-like family protein [candidate division KSB1 bacterium]|nr:YwiC-like family protein [candidate division KSB1 bacterium]MDZ7274213.1 YwiC-like family protein [candidate division KSB1 bacterium]MDZ7287265.1 YwiC-like family protein [candidate division KSB1 bacterium]MDZ7296811.1 YwiC-like family protein [candidate division KSB1 bacterium]MDZ7308436.1 YwiC-like family protein [candidate division KSB1 bacterium]